MIIYRHSSGDMDNFVNYISTKVEKIHQEEKLSLIMGDLNIDLLKSNSSSDNVLYTLNHSFSNL